MNRILRRPMFRMGGTPNEGIMTGLTNPRKDYKDGNRVKQGGIGKMYQLFGNEMNEIINELNEVLAA